MTITTIYNAVSLGSTSSKVNQSPTRTAGQTTTTSWILTARINSQTGLNYVPGAEVEIYYAVLPVSLTADATLPPAVGPNAGVLRCRLNQLGSTDKFTVSPQIPNNGGYLYTWWNSPALAPSGTAPTLTVYSTELP